MSQSISSLMQSYLSNHEKFMSLMSKLTPDMGPELKVLVETSMSLEAEIIKTLPYTAKVEHNTQMGYFLKQQGQQAYIQLIDIKNPTTLAKVEARVTSSFINATFFNTEAEALALVDQVNSAMFRAFIQDWKKSA